MNGAHLRRRGSPPSSADRFRLASRQDNQSGMRTVQSGGVAKQRPREGRLLPHRGVTAHRRLMEHPRPATGSPTGSQSTS
jgi:hypothetical protein